MKLNTFLNGKKMFNPTGKLLENPFISFHNCITNKSTNNSFFSSLLLNNFKQEKDRYIKNSIVLDNKVVIKSTFY